MTNRRRRPRSRSDSSDDKSKTTPKRKTPSELRSRTRKSPKQSTKGQHNYLMGMCRKHREVVRKITEVKGAQDFFKDYIGVLHGWCSEKKLNEYKLGQKSAADLMKLFIVRSGQENTYLQPITVKEVFDNLEEHYA